MAILQDSWVIQVDEGFFMGTLPWDLAESNFWLVL